MGIYRKIEIRTWSDEKFRRLSPMKPSGQALWFYLLTGPQTGQIPGLFKAGHASMAEELGWTGEAFEEAFREVFREGLAKDSPKDRLVWIPNALKYNPPASPNVVLSWSTALDTLPECKLLYEAIEAMREYVYSLDSKGNAYREAFDKAFGKPSGKPFGKPSPKALANQEQEQEQEQEEEYTHTTREDAFEGSAEDDPFAVLPEERAEAPGEGVYPKAVFAAWGKLGDRVYQPTNYLAFANSAWGNISRSVQGLHSDDVLKAIENFGTILGGPPGRYFWNQRISVEAFFERHLVKFLAKNFRPEDFVAGKKPAGKGQLSAEEARLRAEERERLAREWEEASDA